MIVDCDKRFPCWPSNSTMLCFIFVACYNNDSARFNLSHFILCDTTEKQRLEALFTELYADPINLLAQ